MGPGEVDDVKLSLSNFQEWWKGGNDRDAEIEGVLIADGNLTLKCFFVDVHDG